MKHKLACGQMYYLVLHKRDWMYRPAVIVPVKAIRLKHIFTDWIIVEQEIEGIKNKLTVHIDWLAPTIERAIDLLHNMKMWEKRWSANGWRHRLNHKTARSEVAKAISELPIYKQRDILNRFKKAYPDLLKPDNSFKVSKMKMSHWDKLAWATIAGKYPIKEIWAV